MGIERGERPDLSIRQANEKDTQVLADLGARTFRETFEADNTAADMEAYLERSFALDVVQAELGDPVNTFLLAFEARAEEPIGYAKLRAGEPGRSVRGPEPIEIERIYVSRGAIGRGVGAALLRACAAEARKAGKETLWLGVWERNRRAIAVYERWGFVEVGSHEFLLGSDRQRDLILERPVGEL